jgi:hypothetical protein
MTTFKLASQLSIGFTTEIRLYDKGIVYGPHFHGFGAVWHQTPLAHCFKRILEFATTQKQLVHNKVVNDGLEHIGKLMTGASSTSVGYCDVGSGNTAPAAGQTGLDAPIGSRHAITYRFPEGKTITHYDTFYGDQENNGTWKEAALAVGSSGTPIIARLLVNAPTGFTKDTTKTATVAWSITLTAS